MEKSTSFNDGRTIIGREGETAILAFFMSDWMVFSGCFLAMTLRLEGEGDGFFEGEVVNTLFRPFVGVPGEFGVPGIPSVPGEFKGLVVCWKK